MKWHTQNHFVCVVVLQPSQPNGSCRARSVYLTTRLLGRISPLSAQNHCLLLLHKKIFKVFPHMSLCKTSDHWDRAIFDLRSILWKNLVNVHKIELSTKCQKLRPSSFTQEVFPHTSLCKTSDTQGHFWPQSLNLNNLGKGQQDKATCQT